MQELRNGMESHDTSHMDALQALFGFTPAQMQQVRELPITTSWCRYLEDCFQPFLTEQYVGIWSSIGLPPPQTISHCWALFHAVSHAITKLDDAACSIEEVWKSVGAETKSGVSATSADVPHECSIAVFAVLCWGSMMLQPQLRFAAVPCFAIHQLPADHQGLKIDFVHRPIPAIFRNFQKALVRQQFTKKPTAGESTIIFISTINYHSLRTIGKVRIKWVNNLRCHLIFDPRTRTLSVFQFPSFCALTTIANDRGVLYEE